MNLWPWVRDLGLHRTFRCCPIVLCLLLGCRALSTVERDAPAVSLPEPGEVWCPVTVPEPSLQASMCMTGVHDGSVHCDAHVRHGAEVMMEVSAPLADFQRHCRRCALQESLSW